ncbi:MAG: SMP-30/gluconolactonase/LRE family protein, partial [Planctomycetaceae bacterium]
MNYEGNKGKLELKEAVYRIDKNGSVTKVTDELFKPNGLCFSPDYKKVYIADTGASHSPDAPQHLPVFDGRDGGTLSKGNQFVSMAMELDGKTVAGEVCGRWAIWAAMRSGKSMESNLGRNKDRRRF